jgi:hypothetical protein
MRPVIRHWHQRFVREPNLAGLRLTFGYRLGGMLGEQQRLLHDLPLKRQMREQDFKAQECTIRSLVHFERYLRGRAIGLHVFGAVPKRLQQ